MSAWTPARQVRYERAKERGTLGWKCLLCNRPLHSDACPHSLVAHEEAVEECRIIHISRKGMGSMTTEQRRAVGGAIPTTEVIRDAVTFPRDRLGEPLDISPERFEAWLARVRRDAAREALDGLADHIDQIASQFLGVRVGSQKAQDVRDYRDTHYPHPDDEETPMEHNDTRCDSPETLCNDCLHYGAQDGE